MSEEFHTSARPLVIFAGAFGSGKTELAINYARAALRKGESVCLVDLDVVTPYFRVGDYRSRLQVEGMRVIAAPGGLASFELPALSPEIGGAMDSHELHVVVDAGGDPVGARLLASYADRITSRGYDLWLVVNPYRPDTAAPDAIERQARATEASCGLHLSGIAANPNLGDLTEWSDVQRGLPVIEEAAERLELPIVFLAVARTVAADRPQVTYVVLPLTLAVRLPWEVAGEE